MCCIMPFQPCQWRRMMLAGILKQGQYTRDKKNAQLETLTTSVLHYIYNFCRVIACVACNFLYNK